MAVNKLSGEKDIANIHLDMQFYLTCILWVDGIHPGKSKVKAIQGTHRPKNVAELESYLELLTYYNKLIPNLATALVPLYLLLKKAMKWKWSVN